jgi:hypothetical protein
VFGADLKDELETRAFLAKRAEHLYATIFAADRFQILPRCGSGYLFERILNHPNICITLSQPEARVETGRRRRWSDEAQGRKVARQHGISPQHLFSWRKAARRSMKTSDQESALVCMPIAQQPVPHVPARKKRCDMCACSIWVSRSSPLTRYRYCTPCAIALAREYGEPPTIRPLTERAREQMPPAIVGDHDGENNKRPARPVRER